MDDIDKNDITEIKELLEASAKSNPSNDFSKIPGGVPGAVLMMGVLAFLSQWGFEKINGESEKLGKVVINQNLIQQNILQIQENVKQINSYTLKRYTSEDAIKDNDFFQRQIDVLVKDLSKKSDWMESSNNRIFSLERDILEIKEKLK